MSLVCCCLCEGLQSVLCRLSVVVCVVLFCFERRCCSSVVRGRGEEEEDEEEDRGVAT